MKTGRIVPDGYLHVSDGKESRFVWHLHVMEWVQDAIPRYGLIILFIVLTIESIGVPAPGESALIATALYAGSSGELSIYAVVATASVAAITGDNIGYLIGRRAGQPIVDRYGRYVGLTPERLIKGKDLFDRHGGKIVLFGRFFAFLRTFAALLAGLNGMRWPHFLLMNAIGGVLWASVFGFGAYYLGDRIKILHQPYLLLAIALFAIASMVGFHLHQNRSK